MRKLIVIYDEQEKDEGRDSYIKEVWRRVAKKVEKVLEVNCWELYE